MRYQGLGEESNFKREISTQKKKKSESLGDRERSVPGDIGMEISKENSVAIKEGAFREGISPQQKAETSA